MSSIMPLSPSLDILSNIMESTPSFYKGVVTQQSSNYRQLTKGVCNDGDDDAGVYPSEFDAAASIENHGAFLN